MGTQLTPVYKGIWPGLFIARKDSCWREVQPYVAQPNHVPGLQGLPRHLSRNGQGQPDVLQPMRRQSCDFFLR